MAAGMFEAGKVVVQRGPFRIVSGQNVSSDPKRAAITTTRGFVMPFILGEDSAAVQQRQHLPAAFSEAPQNLAMGSHEVLVGNVIVPAVARSPRCNVSRIRLAALSATQLDRTGTLEQDLIVVGSQTRHESRRGLLGIHFQIGLRVDSALAFFGTIAFLIMSILLFISSF